MFERYLTDAVTAHFGHVIENLDADKVRLSAWNGEVVLQDLTLRSNALDSFVPDCPVEIAHGHIGHLELRIPWSVFRSQLKNNKGGTAQPRLLSTSCSVVLSDVTILVTPRRKRRRGESGTGEEEKLDDLQNKEETSDSTDDRRTKKEKLVQSLLHANLLRRVTESTVCSNSRWNWVQDWLSSLLSTLSVTIRNIHVRYEDPGTAMGYDWNFNSRDPETDQQLRYRPSFAVGITLQQFSVESADREQSQQLEEEKEGEGKDDATRQIMSKPTSDHEKRHKVAAAELLAIYWDSDCKLMAIHADQLCQGETGMPFATYYQSAFQVINTNVTSSGNEFAHENLYKHAHSYLLDPISPSVNLTLISLKKDDSNKDPDTLEQADSSESDESTNDEQSPALSQMALTAPSSVRINLPPCKFTLARSTLEDTAYIRKSLSVWLHATKGVLSEATLRRLAKLRPAVSAGDNPKAWWLYAVQASLALSRINTSSTGPLDTWGERSVQLRRRGWIGLVQAVQRRRRYVEQYQTFGQLSKEDQSKQMLKAHNELLRMEDDLLPEEIVAFRLSIYETLDTSHPKGSIPNGVAQASSGGWQLWARTSKDGDPVIESEKDMLSVDHRNSMMHETTLALERERANVRKNVRDEKMRIASMRQLPLLDLDTPETNPEIWKASLVCNEFAIQVNDERLDQTSAEGRMATTPVIRISSVWVQDQSWYEDGSWHVDCSLASLMVKDLTVLKLNLSHGYFPNLFGRKTTEISTSEDDDVVWIDRIRHHKCMSVSIRKKLDWNSAGGSISFSDTGRGSTTQTKVRILPMEVVYSTVPVEIATRVLRTVKTPELVDDYHRMAAAAHGWRERQKKKLLEALAHKHKKILVDVDVGAPELLIPEDISHLESPMLAIDLGRLRLFNDDASKESNIDFDDRWRLILSSIQVRSTSLASFNQQHNAVTAFNDSKIRHLVEPFSLDFAISTKIASETNQDSRSMTKVRIAATLPRLAFNLTSKSIRLVSRLKLQWERRRRANAVPGTAGIPTTLTISNETIPSTPALDQPVGSQMRIGVEEGNKGNSTSRVIEFDFTAPFVGLQLANDVDETISQSLAESQPQIPLIDLALRGIRGNVTLETSTGGHTKTTFDARLHSLGIIDLFQRAGKDFALLMSSASPEKLDDLTLHDEKCSWRSPSEEHSTVSGLWSGHDLVTVQYFSTNQKLPDGTSIADKLSIGFHELFIEWNPETFASIQKAIHVPIDERNTPNDYVKTQDNNSFSDDEFFDAMEDEDLDHRSNNDSIRLVSEVSSSFETAEADLQSFGPVRKSSWSSSGFSLGFQHSMASDPTMTISPPRMVHSSVIPLSAHPSAYPIPRPLQSTAAALTKEARKAPAKPFELVFKLEKLRVSFNKETRHRKVMVAQMDGTSVSYATKTSGGSKTQMHIGNLVFNDPSSIQNATLYGQILGLKTRGQESAGKQPSSLLEMEILINPTERSYESDLDTTDDRTSCHVTIDRKRGTVIGCNSFVSAKFSPMRFVFLEQLWFEIIDYFFEGVIGTSVWGGKKPSSQIQTSDHEDIDIHRETDFLPGSDAGGFNFTRFDIFLDSPELLLPVTYRSPHFLRLDLSSIRVSNRYDGALIDPSVTGIDTGPRMQWFNNCSIALNDLCLFSWSGRELGAKPVTANITLRWPTGPTAPLVVPKWRVKCIFDNLDITFRRTDYALVQHIISHNIGEVSRHLGEWHALQDLPRDTFLAFMDGIMVQFGYDKKDVTPTTYDLEVVIPSVTVKFIESEGEDTIPLAIARCLDLIWNLRKESDLITKQRATCDVDLVAPSSSADFEKLLSSWKYDQGALVDDADVQRKQGVIPELTYTSTTLPSGDNTKTLEFVDACIYACIPAWRRFSGFFSSLPDPALFREADIASSIQVGDRWYRIGGEALSEPKHNKLQAKDKNRFSWMKSFPLTKRSHGSMEMLRASVASYSPTFQFRASLASPRIILSSMANEEAMSRLVLRMHRLDFLHVNSGAECSISRSFLLHELEVYTLSTEGCKQNTREGENSLIHPWSVGVMVEKCNGMSSERCDTHSTRISADILQARAAYSDMAIAIEVCLSVAHEAKEATDRSQTHMVRNASASDSFAESAYSSDNDSNALGTSLPALEDGDHGCNTPIVELFDAECDGFELRIADDSGRHFAGTQDLIILSLGKILCSRRERIDRPTTMDLRLQSLDLYDCLQAIDSPFRAAASTRTGLMELRSQERIPTFVKDSKQKSVSNMRKFSWDDFKMREFGTQKFKPSPLLAQRLLAASTECTDMRDHDKKFENPRSIEVFCEMSEATGQKYHVRLQSLSLQWNPSTIIAIQRFLGRLRKESKSKIVQVFNEEIDDLIATQSMDFGENPLPPPTNMEQSEQTSIQLTVEVKELSVCLNKEHQNRRLLEITLSACNLHLDSSGSGMIVDGHVGNLEAWDSDTYKNGIHEQNRNVLRVISSTEVTSVTNLPEFLRVHFRTFKKSDSSTSSDLVSPWVQGHISDIGGIDDFLSFKVASTQFTYLKGRTEELVDYLSNGLPGKGMGATSRAAKGFISKRILTKSFLEFRNLSPQVFLPQHENSSNGIIFKLGDVNMRSYFEQETETQANAANMWWRILSLELSGFQVGLMEMSNFSPVTNSIDLGIDLRKPTSKGGELSVQGKLTFVDLILKYSDYVLIRYVTSDNLGRKVDTDKWDNIEKAYWSEEAIETQSVVANAPNDDTEGTVAADVPVAYSTNARFVRYGKAGKQKRKIEQNRSLDERDESLSPLKSRGNGRSSLDIRFELDGLSLKLHRDDTVDGIGEQELVEAFQYDMILLRVQMVEISLNTNDSGDMSFHLSLFRLGLFDLGDRGRLIRERYYSHLARDGHSPKGRKRKGLRSVCPFHVLAEGYVPDVNTEGSPLTTEHEDGPQFVVTVDRCPASSAGAIGSIADLQLPDESKMTIARIVVNYLSLNALIRPLKETVAFLSCEWPNHRHAQLISTVGLAVDKRFAAEDVSKTTPKAQSGGLQFKLVAHYPRVFFLADENDSNSRALVLRGLAVVNMSKTTRVEGFDVQRVTSVDAQLHSMESYINPDVHQALSFKQKHAEMVGESNLAAFPQAEMTTDADNDNSLGVALIQPVTTGLEFCEIKRELFPTKRSVFVNIESVSTMLSFEDLNLIETVLARLSAARASQPRSSEDEELLVMYTKASDAKALSPTPGGGSDTYEVLFASQRLGLGLRTESGQTVVNSIQSTDHDERIRTGHKLISIDGEHQYGQSLENVVTRLSHPKRPITIKFSRPETDTLPKREMTDPSPFKQVAIAAENQSTPVTSPNQQIEEVKDFALSSFTIHYQKGLPNGLVLEKSVCGSFLVVTKVLACHTSALSDCLIHETNDNEIETTLGRQSARVPRAGAVIAAISGTDIFDISPDEMWLRMANLTETKAETTSADAFKDRDEEGEIYSLTFKELDSKLWGKVESIDISSSGIALSFIDDLHGRDMPLFRAKLSALEVHAGRGLSDEAHIIEVQAPSILKLAPNETNEQGRTLITLSKSEIDDLKSESIMGFSGIAICSIDYFHPQIAYWEPLLEPSQLFLLLEKQEGSIPSCRPGQVALEISDRLLREQKFRGNTLPALGAGPQMVSFNLTDASSEVFVKAVRQWKEWRKSITEMHEDDQDADFDNIELHESNLSEAAALAPSAEAKGGQLLEDNPDALPTGHTHQRAIGRAASSKAAQAALVFAQKRGADTNKKGDTAKPFVFRNRTGISVAFVQDEIISKQERSRASLSRVTSENNLSVVGEYASLEAYSLISVHELADQEDARFSMEILSDKAKDGSDLGGPTGGHATSNKVRNYEGRFPSLTVAIQAVSGVSVAPLIGLQVHKVGSTVCHLLVKKDKGDGQTGDHLATEYSIPLIWKVEIEDNRRVLTLSTAVRIVTTAFNTQIEIGVKKILGGESTDAHRKADERIVSIGLVRPELPFHMPLWLTLKLESVSVFVRPRFDGESDCDWGSSSVLKFGPLQPFENRVDGLSCGTEYNGTWVWEETFEELNYVRCDIIGQDPSPRWLSVFSGSSSEADLTGNKTSSTHNFEEDHHEVISVTIDSSVTLRNMLPMSIDWQLSHILYGASPAVVGGSTFRGDDMANISAKLGSSPGVSLDCGECIEVFSCDYETSELQVRLKEPDGQNWSSWAPLVLQEEPIEFDSDQKDTDVIDETLQTIFPRARQVNVQVTNDTFGVPLTIGVRIIPKLTFPTVDGPRQAQTYGIEVVIYAELWIRNITSLPLNFGCPSHQLHGNGSNGAEICDESATRFNAESALMEIANLLEVGEKGTGLNKKIARQTAETGGIESLPNQECDELSEEVFEYLEIEFSTVKRRWWASESYDIYRMNITQSNENGRWLWIDDNWHIDTAGEVTASLAGWESCRNLLAGAGSFSGTRPFDASHSIRRRRYFRNRTGRVVRPERLDSSQSNGASKISPGSLHGDIQAFHQPLKDSFSREQRKLQHQSKRKKAKGTGDSEIDDTEALTKIAVKCGDGKWSVPTTIPATGTSHGALRVLASRWAALTSSQQSSRKDDASREKRGLAEISSPFQYREANLSSDLYELCYTVSDVEGEWGEFSRSMVVSPRFLVRNDSERCSIEIKQAGAADSTSLKLPPGSVGPFYWTDFRLPGLVSVSPCATNSAGQSVYKWSGGFDICNLGMVPLRIRRESSKEETQDVPVVRSIRALVEIRPGTGGFGINISFREEDPNGDGSLFRIENLSPFPVWLSQDGVLANPSTFHPSTAQTIGGSFGFESRPKSQNVSQADGDMVRPEEKISFALDVPYRQGKYAHRKEATLMELLRIRIALAPLAHRAGIETMKVLGMTTVGESIRLNPSKLVGALGHNLRTNLYTVRVLAIVSSDGPTRVVKLVLMNTADQDVFGSAFRDVSYNISSRQNDNGGNRPVQSPRHDEAVDDISQGAMEAKTLLASGELPNEDQAKREALFADLEKQTETRRLTLSTKIEGSQMDQIYSIRVEFTGFVFSLVDSAPSEIAVASLRNFNALARWNALRTNEASLMLSVGWLQVDNHVPSAPFKVAIRPDKRHHNSTDDNNPGGDDSIQGGEEAASPLLMVAIAFAPKHKSGIVCLRSVTVAPRNLVIAVDLAFLVRLQRFFLGLKDHFRAEEEAGRGGLSSSLLSVEHKRSIAFPHFVSPEEELQRNAAFGTENQKLYFQGLTILPADITLSVAPARALTPVQANLEGKEIAAIHQAVRKGDVLVGSSSALLGVNVGRKNTTPLAVVRGVFKSIIVDALLRLDGASLHFSGVFLRNHISTGPQLSTYLLTHYLASLRHNVPALLGSLAAFGNPLGLIRGLGDGMSDFVSEPVRGLKKSVQELDPTYLVDGVARGTGSLARHAVGGFADSASLLTETFSKNMAVLTLDRRYAQKRDRSRQLRLNAETTVTLAGGVESGFVKLVQGFMDGVTGVVKAPIRGAEKKGIEGFAKGIGKGLLGLLVKPMIGISDAATDLMIGVKNTVENPHAAQQSLSLDRNQLRPRRPMYGRDRVLRPYKLEDAAAATLMLRTRCAGETYLSHMDMGDRVALLSVKRFILLGPKGQELMALKYKHVSRLEVRQIPEEDGSIGWAIIILLNTPRRNGSEVEVLACTDRQEASELCAHIKGGVDLVES